jgi:hypothetical protein
MTPYSSPQSRIRYESNNSGWITLLVSFLLVVIALGLPVAATRESVSADYQALGSGGVGSEPVAIEVSELQKAVSSAISQIESGSYAAHQLLFLDEVIARSNRVLHRADGSFEIVKELDPQVVHELTSFGNPDRPVAEVDHEYVNRAILVNLGGVVYEGREGGIWNTMEVSPEFRPLAIDLTGMANGEYTPTDKGSSFQASREFTQDGGTLWTFTETIDGSTSRQIWDVDSEGYLRSYTLEFSEWPERGHITFKPLVDPPAIFEPEVGEAVDLRALGLSKLDAGP